MTLCTLTTIWMGALLVATPAPWRVLRSAFRLSPEQLGDACWIQLVLCHGLAEPSLLTLIMLLFRSKASVPSTWQPWRLLRTTAIVGAFFTTLQAVFCLVQKYAGGQRDALFLRPEPRLSHNLSALDAEHRIASEPFGPDVTHPWLRNEGCADSTASVRLAPSGG